MAKDLIKKQMLSAFAVLDRILPSKVKLIIGGGGAMVLAHEFPLATVDVDGYPTGMDVSEFDTYVKKVAEELSLAKDWLNPYFSTFGHTLPPDYGDRLISVFEGKHLKALALGREDLLVMKCFAGRPKDVSHARALVKKGANTDLVESHIWSLIKKRIPGAEKALEFLHNADDWKNNKV